VAVENEIKKMKGREIYDIRYQGPTSIVLSDKRPYQFQPYLLNVEANG
jgi:hypothetical protein